MSNSYEEIKEQNKQLVDEAFRVTRLYNQAKSELEELKQKGTMTSSQLGINPFFSDRNELLRKLVDAEKALNEKTETNRKLAQFLNDADVRADEARKLLLVTQNVLQMKEQENLKLAEQLKTKEADNESKQTIAELKSHLHSKESELAIVSNEMVTTQRLLAEKEERIEKMNEERLLLFPPTIPSTTGRVNQ